ncbi:hypothetical protein PZA11_004037 [Diplocarpon coronariae]|uniref:ABM domain-containing protein n=1 Tax=Diplocarpon coronariae TaxID=2795749 RepID=A0A218YVU7_9HELO|nr:hypothetical protein JHW43_003871 [Diplocarpon mali]OWO99442.1 hypothetical protein B2J93_3883 [Marssonina coronariae]
MAITQITQFTASPTDEPLAAIAKAFESKDPNAPQHFVLGSQIQEEDTYHTLSQHVSLASSQAFLAQNPSANASFQSLHATFNTPLFAPGAPGTAPVIEYAQVFFPASKITPEFQAAIEADFLRFDAIMRRCLKGDVGLAYGWAEEELEHEDLDEGARSFLVLRGWESMAAFQGLLGAEEYREAIGILFDWQTPFSVWHVERKLSSGST